MARHLDVPRQYIGRWKKGKGAKGGDDFPREYAEKAAEFLGVPAAILLGLSKPTPAPGPYEEIVAAFARILPSLSEERRQRLLAELRDAALLEGLEELVPVSPGATGKKA